MDSGLQEFATRAAAVSDQVIAEVLSMAEQVAAYHRKLLQEGVPKALAGDLTMQAAYQIWNPGCCCHGDEG